MSSKLVLFKLLLLGYALTQQGSFGKLISIGSEPNVTDLMPTIAISRNISLFATDINLFLSVYQRPINATSQDTLKVLKGSTSVNSTERCISAGFSFDFGGQLPIQNDEETGNGGCDALWGRNCSQSILTALKQFSGKVNDSSCGVGTGNIQVTPPPGCPDAFKLPSTFTTVAILRNGSFMVSEASATDPSKTWIYYQSDPSSDGDYNRLIKYSVFTYFVGRPYTSGQIDAAIACLSPFNKTVGPGPGPDPGNMATRFPRPGNFILLLLSFVILFYVLA